MKIEVTYRQKKSGISMRATKQGEIHVSAPLGTTQAEIDAFLEKNREWMEQAVARRAHATEVENDFFSGLPLETSSQCYMATRRLNAIIPPLLKKYSKMMRVNPSGISYRRSKTRWGSCNVKTRHINFSAYLLLLPDWCIEHVVVHELAHLIVPNHSADFYREMDRYFPRWKEAREETRRISRLEDRDDDV